MLVSCVAAALVFLAAAGVSHVPVWALVLSLGCWASLVFTLLWQSHARAPAFDEIKPRLPLSPRSGPPAL